MNGIKKAVIISALVIATVAGTGYLATTHAFAQSGQAPYESLVQKIADTFHLNKNDVQAVFDQYKQQQVTNRQNKFSAHLDQLVQQGKITAAQKQKILDKMKELQTNRQNNKTKFKSMTPAQRKAALQSQRQDLQNWAQQNGINLQYLGPFGMGRGMGMRGHWQGK